MNNIHSRKFPKYHWVICRFFRYTINIIWDFIRSCWSVLTDEESEFNLDGNRLALANIGGELANVGGSAGSEHSNDTENLDQKDVSAVYENYREIFNEHKISERDQVYILKSFENKSEQDVRLFMQ